MLIIHVYLLLEYVLSHVLNTAQVALMTLFA